MTNTLTLETLIKKGACLSSQQAFAQLFPNGALVAVETFVNVASQLDWSCAAKLLLTPRNHVKFKKLAAHARHTHAVAYGAACDTYESAFDTYADAYETYDTSCEFRDARDAAHAAYNATCNVAFATAFAELYIQQESQTS